MVFRPSFSASLAFSSTGIVSRKLKLASAIDGSSQLREGRALGTAARKRRDLFFCRRPSSPSSSPFSSSALLASRQDSGAARAAAETPLLEGVAQLLREKSISREREKSGGERKRIGLEQLRERGEKRKKKRKKNSTSTFQPSRLRSRSPPRIPRTERNSVVSRISSSVFATEKNEKPRPLPLSPFLFLYQKSSSSSLLQVVLKSLSLSSSLSLLLLALVLVFRGRGLELGLEFLGSSLEALDRLAELFAQRRELGRACV